MFTFLVWPYSVFSKPLKHTSKTKICHHTLYNNVFAPLPYPSRFYPPSTPPTKKTIMKYGEHLYTVMMCRVWSCRAWDPLQTLVPCTQCNITQHYPSQLPRTRELVSMYQLKDLPIDTMRNEVYRSTHKSTQLNWVMIDNDYWSDSPHPTPTQTFRAIPDGLVRWKLGCNQIWP